MAHHNDNALDSLCAHIEVTGYKCHTASNNYYNLECVVCHKEITPCKCGEGLENDKD